MQTFETDTRGTTFDLELFRCRALGSTTVEAGMTMNDQLQVLVSNATNADPASQDYTLRIYLSTNNNISTSDTLLATWNYNGIDFGSISNITFNIPAPSIPSSTVPGDYWIGEILDEGTDSIPANNDTDRWDAQQLVVTAPAPPVNDNWNNTIFIADPDFTVTGTNVNATTQADEQNLENTGSTVWWFVDADVDGELTIDTFGSNYDTQLHVYEYSPNFADLNLIANNDDTGGLQSQVIFMAAAGQCYEIRVGGYTSTGGGTSGAEGDIVLNGSFVPGGVLLGDVNGDGVVSLLDVQPFVDLLTTGGFQPEADVNQDGVVSLLDVDPFVALLVGG